MSTTYPFQNLSVETRPDVAALAEMIYNTRFRFKDEKELQGAVETLLEGKGVEYMREKILSPRNRIDFLCGTTGIEIKIDSSTSSVERQLWRYAQDDRIQNLILVTSCSRHQAVSREINGKSIIVVYLLISIF